MRVAPSPLKAELRRQLRRARRAWNAAEHAERSRRAALHVLTLPGFAAGKRVALYMPFDRETDTRSLIEAGERRGTRLYLPVITDRRRRRMRFLPYSASLRLGHFGIHEPEESDTPVPARWLHLIVLPLVGVDAHGHRLGMGAGFYDRLLAHRTLGVGGFGPRLVGLAFDAQRTERCFADAWDIRLDYLATESGLHRFMRGTDP